MGWSATPICTETTDWRDVEFLNEFVAAKNERERAVYKSLTPAYDVGDIVQYMDIPRSVAGNWGSAEKNSRGDNWDDIPATETIYDMAGLPDGYTHKYYRRLHWDRKPTRYESDSGYLYPRDDPDPRTEPSADDEPWTVGMRALGDDGWVYEYDGSVWQFCRPQQSADIVEERGKYTTQHDEIIGPWIFNEAQAMISAHRYLEVSGGIGTDGPPDGDGSRRWGSVTEEYEDHDDSASATYDAAVEGALDLIDASPGSSSGAGYLSRVSHDVSSESVSVHASVIEMQIRYPLDWNANYDYPLPDISHTATLWLQFADLSDSYDVWRANASRLGGPSDYTPYVWYPCQTTTSSGPEGLFPALGGDDRLDVYPIPDLPIVPDGDIRKKEAEGCSIEGGTVIIDWHGFDYQ